MASPPVVIGRLDARGKKVNVYRHTIKAPNQPYLVVIDGDSSGRRCLVDPRTTPVSRQSSVLVFDAGLFGGPVRFDSASSTVPEPPPTAKRRRLETKSEPTLPKDAIVISLRRDFDVANPAHAMVVTQCILGITRYTIFPRDHNIVADLGEHRVAITLCPDSTYMLVNHTSKEEAGKLARARDIWLDAIFGIHETYANHLARLALLPTIEDAISDVITPLIAWHKSFGGPFPRFAPNAENFLTLFTANLLVLYTFLQECIQGFISEWGEEFPEADIKEVWQPATYKRYRIDHVRSLLGLFYREIFDDLRQSIRRNVIDICKYVPYLWPDLVCYPVTPARTAEIVAASGDWLLSRVWNPATDQLIAFELNAAWPYNDLFGPHNIFWYGGLGHVWKSQVRDALLLMLEENDSHFYNVIFERQWYLAEHMLLGPMLCPEEQLHDYDIDIDPAVRDRATRKHLLAMAKVGLGFHRAMREVPPEVTEDIRREFINIEIIQGRRQIGARELRERMVHGIKQLIRKRNIAGTEHNGKRPTITPARKTRETTSKAVYDGLRIGLSNVTACFGKGCKGHDDNPTHLFFQAAYGRLDRPTHIAIKTQCTGAHKREGSSYPHLATIRVPPNFMSQPCSFRYKGEKEEWSVL